MPLTYSDVVKDLQVHVIVLTKDVDIVKQEGISPMTADVSTLCQNLWMGSFAK